MRQSRASFPRSSSHADKVKGNETHDSYDEASVGSAVILSALRGCRRVVSRALRKLEGKKNVPHKHAVLDALLHLERRSIRDKGELPLREIVRSRVREVVAVRRVWQSRDTADDRGVAEQQRRSWAPDDRVWRGIPRFERRPTVTSRPAAPREAPSGRNGGRKGVRRQDDVHREEACARSKAQEHGELLRRAERAGSVENGETVGRDERIGDFAVHFGR